MTTSPFSRLYSAEQFRKDNPPVPSPVDTPPCVGCGDSAILNTAQAAAAQVEGNSKYIWWGLAILGGGGLLLYAVLKK